MSLQTSLAMAIIKINTPISTDEKVTLFICGVMGVMGFGRRWKAGDVVEFTPIIIA